MELNIKNDHRSPTGLLTAYRAARYSLITLLLFCVIAAPARALENSESLLWRISDGESDSYLFGTIHLDDERVIALPEKVLHAFNNCRRLLLEVRMDDTAVQQTQNMFLRSAGSLLSDDLDQRQYRDVISRLSMHGVPQRVADRLKIWAAAVTLLAPKMTTGVVLDLWLQQQAIRSQKPVYGLETIDEQLGIFNGLTLPEQRELLQAVLTMMPKRDALYGSMTQAYVDGNLRSLIRLSKFQFGDQDTQLAKRLEALLIDERNQKMMIKILPHISAGSAFIAVGALHLPGRNGIVSLLKAGGRRVEPVVITQ